jgi:hypothetical protein
MVFHTNPASLPEPTPDERGVLSMPPQGRPIESETPHAGIAYQGMLMDPYALTGHRNDPTIHEATRRNIIRDSLKLGTDNVVDYNINKVPKSKREGYDTAIENAAHDSGIPTHIFQNNVNVPTIVKKSLGRNTSGDYGAHDRRHAIRVKEGWPVQDFLGKETVTEQKYERGKAIPNPNFQSMVKDLHPSQRGYSFKEVSRVHTPEGEEKDISHYTDPNRNHEYKIYDVRDLPAGHTMNIWPGKGEESDSHYVHSYKINNGTTDSGRRKSTWIHTRHEKIPAGEPVTREKNVYSDYRPAIPESTVVHEIGHSIDPHIGQTGTYNPGGRDTVKEALADGFEDRFSLHKDNYETALHPSPQRATEMKQRGYTTKDKSVAGSNINKALYAAVRQHVSMGDNNFKDIESRNNLTWASNNMPVTHAGNREEGNALLLGHLYTHHSHVREILGHLGLSDIGEQAASHYRSRITDAGRAPYKMAEYEKGQGFTSRENLKPAHQDTLPGM